MSRSIRIEYAGALYHVMARGNHRDDIFFCDDDHRFFIKTMADVCGRTGWLVHAWVLMSNHYHLMIETPEPNLVEGMKWLQNTYTRRLNTKHQLWGRVFGDRYKSIIVENDKGHYFTTLMDYIHLNPARAGLVGAEQSVADYPWSSLHAAYARPVAARPSWSCVLQGLGAFGLKDTVAGRRQFIERIDQRARQEDDPGFVPLPTAADARVSHLRRGWYWGTPEFAEKTMKRAEEKMRSAQNATYRSGMVSHAHDLARAEEIIARGLECVGLSHADLKVLSGSDPRKLAIAWELSQRTGARQDWIASQLQMKSAANVSQQLRRLRDATHPLFAKYQEVAAKLSEFFD